jgi:pimeloyl-ACP methyl ester carboxylesterase
MEKFIAIALIALSFIANGEEVIDHTRQRSIPVEVSYPQSLELCTQESKCPVAFLSAGYGVSHTRYQFLVDVLTEQGFLVVAIGHELAGDPPLSVTGNLFETRAENWSRGAQTLSFVRQVFSSKYPSYDFDHLTLVGHSNGGDISAWLIRQSPDYVEAIITLDHRRVPLPRSEKIKVLSLRASDFDADEGVLPNPSEQKLYGSCIINMANARHNDMTDLGPERLQLNMQSIIRQWLRDKYACAVPE